MEEKTKYRRKNKPGKHDNLDELEAEMKDIKVKIQFIKHNMTTRKVVNTNPDSPYPVRAGYSTATRRPVRDIVAVLDRMTSILDLLIEDYECRMRY